MVALRFDGCAELTEGFALRGHQVVRRMERHHLMGWLSLFAHRELIASWTQRDLASRYRGSYLGSAWSILNPLFSLALYTFVFSVIMKIRFGEQGHGSFAIYLMCGLLPWIAISEALTRSTSVVPANQNLVKKVVFPLETLPVSLVASSIINQLIGLVILLVAVGFFVGLKLTWLWLPIILLVQAGLMLGTCWFLASLGVFVRDIAQAIGLVLNVWMYMTPIVYPASMVPENFRWLLALNPVAFLVEAYRAVILDGRLPDMATFMANAFLAFVVMALGYAWFARTKPAFADVL